MRKPSKTNVKVVIVYSIIVVVFILLIALLPTYAQNALKSDLFYIGTHGVNWGAKLGGGYYAYVTNQHANVLTVIDPDPDGDDNGSDAAVVGTILLANGSPWAGPTDGTGGQGIKPLPMTHDGWIQKTVDLVGTGILSVEVEGWIAALTDQSATSDAEVAEDSFDVLPAILGTSSGKPLRTSMIVHSPNGNYAIRKGDWKYIEGKASPTLNNVSRRDELVPQLYNARRYGCEVASWPVLASIEAACVALPEFERAAPEVQPDAPTTD